MGSKWPSRRPGPQSPCQGRAPLRTPAGAGGLMKGCDLGSCPTKPASGGHSLQLCGRCLQQARGHGLRALGA